MSSSAKAPIQRRRRSSPRLHPGPRRAPAGAGAAGLAAAGVAAAAAGPAAPAPAPARRAATAVGAAGAVAARIAARLGGLALLFGLLAGCGAVGKGPDTEPAADMSRPADLTPLPACTPKNCAGCCLGEVCQPGSAPAACGTAGAACSVCSDAQKCGADFRCAFDPGASWLVAIAKAQILPQNPQTGGPWRTDGTMPQPLVQFDATKRTAAVAIIVSGSPPVWTASWNTGFVYSAQELLSTGIDLQVFDQQGAMTLSPMTQKHHVTLSQQDFATKSLTYQDWEGAKTLSVVLQRR